MLCGSGPFAQSRRPHTTLPDRLVFRSASPQQQQWLSPGFPPVGLRPPGFACAPASSASSSGSSIAGSIAETQNGSERVRMIRMDQNKVYPIPRAPHTECLRAHLLSTESSLRRAFDHPDPHLVPFRARPPLSFLCFWALIWAEMGFCELWSSSLGASGSLLVGGDHHLSPFTRGTRLHARFCCAFATTAPSAPPCPLPSPPSSVPRPRSTPDSYPEHPLRCSINDTEAMSAALVPMGFETTLLKDANFKEFEKATRSLYCTVTVTVNKPRKPQRNGNRRHSL